MSIFAKYEAALTHKTWAEENGGDHYDRLEFLGDAILQACTSHFLLERFPNADAGALTDLRKSLVKNETLATISEGLQLGTIVRLGKGEASQGGDQRQKLLADVFEALLGAIYLDQGLDAARDVVDGVFGGLLDHGHDPRDAKTVLQEWCQRALPGQVPSYEETGEEGPPHARIFHMAVVVDGKTMGEGSGTSKQRARHGAARAAVRTLKI